MQNMLVNLLLNAIQASKPGGKVVIATQGGDAVRIRVTDEGCGIAPENQQKIFEPFFSLRQGGTGLGLFLSLNAVRSWGGTIVVESTPGQGAQFEVVIPPIYSGPATGGRTMKPTSLLLVDDDAAFRRVMAGELGRIGYDVDAVGTGEEAIQRVAATEPEVVLLDLRLPGMGGIETLKALQTAAPATEVIMLTGHGSIDTAIESIRIGACDYVVKPCPLDELQIRIQRALERRSLRQRANILESGLTPPDLGSSFVGSSPEFRRLLNLIERVAPSDSTVLITGETGVGKERVAKLIHARSSRRLRPFVVVECAALQESLLQSELFGHERGAFTGAERAKPGLFEVANGGTIFLDEIGEVSPATQTKLLRVLDTSTFRHVGGTREIKVDVRVLTATNRDVPCDGAAGPIPRGLVLPSEYDHGRVAALARPSGGRGTAGPTLRHRAQRTVRLQQADWRSSIGAPAPAQLARKRARTPARGRSCSRTL